MGQISVGVVNAGSGAVAQDNNGVPSVAIVVDELKS